MWFRAILHRANLKRRDRTQDEPELSGVHLLSRQAIRQLNRLQLNASRYLPGAAVGQRPSLRRRPAYDFREHRMYVPGDDVRFVDWKASARQEHIFVKQGEYPKEVSVHLLLDCSASMKWGDPPKAICALKVAAALGFLALAHGDRLYVHPLFGSPAQVLGPISGKGQTAALLNHLRLLPFQGQADLEQTVHRLVGRTQGGLTLLISDLLDVTNLAAILDALAPPAWDVIVLHLLHPEELKPTLHGNFEMLDAESGQGINYDIDARARQQYEENVAAWRSQLETTCHDHNAFYTFIPTHWSLAGEILPHLRAIHLVTPR
jgi:uncharacterized protein (DUF58 family)